jgi:GNAT superfamily N-acetyltransferase
VDNQREGYDRVVEAGAALGLGGPGLGGPGLGGPGLGDLGQSGPVLGGYERGVSLLSTALTDSRVRADLTLAGRQVVDGLGAWRVVRMWEQAHRLGPLAAPSGLSEQGPSRDHETSGRLTARRAQMDDARLLWEWRNDPAARAGSHNADLVPWPQHLAWLESSLTREDRVLLVAEDPAGPVGTVRWDRGGQGEWEVSITVAPSRRGQSLARSLLRAGEAALSEVAWSDVALSDVAHSSGTEVTAYLAVVHVDNAGSVRLFETSAYVPDLPPDPGGFMRYRKAAPVA